VAGTDEVRLAELVAALSLATDLGLGLPQEHVLRQTVIATRLARLAGFEEAARADTFYVSLLAWVGCVADSHELAHWFGDDRQLRADSYQVDKTGLPMLRLMLGHVGADASPLRRITMIGRFLAGGYRDAAGSFVTHCQTTGDVADRLGIGASVRSALAQAFERWDGKGVPGTVGGTGIEPVMRVVQIADDAEVFARTAGVEAARAMLRSRRGTEFDPGLIDLLTDHADQVLADLDDIDAWQTVIDDCPDLDRRIPDHELDDVLTIMADYADLKSPRTLGHSRAVAELAAAAAELAGLSAADTALVRRAALVHRLGATGVSTSIWNKTEPLSAMEWERVRTVPYLTERILRRQSRLAGIAEIAGMCHERMDGSGYPRGLRGASIPPSARLLAAADAYQSLGEQRPGQTPLTDPERAATCRREVEAGRLDAAAVQAVLAAAGHRMPRRRSLVAGLTAREAEVLDLLVRGLTNRQIAERLVIAPRTVATHVEHILAKTGCASRGAAAMFALRHGLVDATLVDVEDR
jgi:HD-GYP domain-containing protein (c-di-GMP phosphodiesterase class II)